MGVGSGRAAACRHLPGHLWLMRQPARAARAFRTKASTPAASPASRSFSKASRPSRKWRAWASTSCRLARRMSRHICGSPAAMRVKSRKPGPPRRMWSAPSGCESRPFMYANASRCGRWLTAAKVVSCACGDIRCTWLPTASQTLRALSTWLAALRSVGVRITCRPLYRSASAWSTPADSLPAMGWAGTKAASASPSPSALRAASTTSDLVEPTSITSAPAPRPSRMAARVDSVAATGTASSTRSLPATAAAAEVACASITPRSRARAAVAGERL